jgi:DNA-binding transcriptional LysR family regulator
MNNIDLRRVDLNLLVVFETLMTERHVGRAAQRLNVGQSAVSHALARLRDLFGDPLFVRHPKGIEPTKRSLALGPRIADVLNRTRAALVSDPDFDPGRSHRFTVGQTDGSIPILVALMERLRETAPNIELHVRRIDADGLIGAIDRQELDLGFAVMASARPIARIVRVPVLKIRYVGIARRNHPALRMLRSSDKFAALPHLAISPRGEPATYVDGLLAELGLRRNTVLTIPHFLAAPLIVACTDLIAIIDESIARLFANDARLSIFELPVTLSPITIDMLAAAARTEEAALTWLREQCVEVSAIIGGRKPGAAIYPPRLRYKTAFTSRSILAQARTRLVRD